MLVYLYLLLLLIVISVLMASMLKQKKPHRLKSRSRRVGSGISKAVSLLIPQYDTRLYKHYMRQTRYLSISVVTIFKIKQLLFLCILFLLALIKLTNIAMYDRVLFHSYEYKTDVMLRYSQYYIADETQALHQEIEYFEKALAVISQDGVHRLPKDQIEDQIRQIVSISETLLHQPRETLINKLYYRVYDYYHYRQWHLLSHLCIAFFSTLLLDIGMMLYNFFIRSEAKKEIKYLKKLIVLNGTLKPARFNEVLSELIDKSKYHKKVLLMIEHKNAQNSMDNKVIYRELIKNTKDLETKLFYEKLEQANNYDFDQAIANIRSEAKLDERTQKRRIKKMNNIIEAFAVGMFIVMLIYLMVYVIIPWLADSNFDTWM